MPQAIDYKDVNTQGWILTGHGLKSNWGESEWVLVCKIIFEIKYLKIQLLKIT